jgi:hypothetical protein
VEIVYLACPYSKGLANVRLARFNAATHVAAKLIEQRLVVFSPITMTHPIDLVLATEGNTLGSDYWVEFDTSFMDVCAQIMVLAMPGWEDSSGIQRELVYFKKRGISPKFLLPEEYGVIASDPAFRAAFDFSS